MNKPLHKNVNNYYGEILSLLVNNGGNIFTQFIDHSFQF
jgi:hypothetical protein